MFIKKKIVILLVVNLLCNLSSCTTKKYTSKLFFQGKNGSDKVSLIFKRDCGKRVMLATGNINDMMSLYKKGLDRFKTQTTMLFEISDCMIRTETNQFMALDAISNLPRKESKKYFISLLHNEMLLVPSIVNSLGLNLSSFGIEIHDVLIKFLLDDENNELGRFACATALHNFDESVYAKVFLSVLLKDFYSKEAFDTDLHLSLMGVLVANKDNPLILKNIESYKKAYPAFYKSLTEEFARKK